MLQEITGDMKVAEVIGRWPQTLDVFRGKGCSDVRDGFPSAMVRFMTVRNAARMDGIELDSLLKALNMVASGAHQQVA
jgi:hypothetical protein